MFSEKKLGLSTLMYQEAKYYIYTHAKKKGFQMGVEGKQQCQTMDGIIAKREHLFLWITDRAATSAKTQDQFSLLAILPRGAEVLKPA